MIVRSILLAELIKFLVKLFAWLMKMGAGVGDVFKISW